MARLRRPLIHWPSRLTGQIEFCDRCASVCDAGCRAAKLRDQTPLRILTAGRPVL